MEKHTHQRLTVSTYRRFGFSFGLGMLILTLVGLWRKFPQPVIIVTGALCLYHWIMGFFLPQWLWFSEWVVSSLWKIVSHLISKLLLAVLFYLILTPFFWILRLTGQDHIHSNHGHWQDFSKRENDPTSMEHWF